MSNKLPSRKDAPLASPALLAALDRINKTLAHQTDALDVLSQNVATVNNTLHEIKYALLNQNGLLEQQVSDAAYDGHVLGSRNLANGIG